MDGSGNGHIKVKAKISNPESRRQTTEEDSTWLMEDSDIELDSQTS